MKDLFEIPESLSPRLLWLEKHGFLTHFYDGGEDELGDAPSPWMALLPLEEDKGKTIAEAMAGNCRVYDDLNLIGYGNTEAEAIELCAVLNKIRLWNET